VHCVQAVYIYVTAGNMSATMDILQRW